MFCFQCEQTAKGTGCNVAGVCGKSPDVAALQDLLLHVAKGLARYAHRLAGLGHVDRDANIFIVRALFTTVTNVNFDADSLVDVLRQGREVGQRLKAKYAELCSEPEVLCSEGCQLADTTEAMIAQAQSLQIDKRQAADGEDIVGLQELITYGLKGAAAYADHAYVLDVADDAVFATFNEILDYLAGNPKDVGELTATALKVGDLNMKVMELLDKGNTETFGHPEPTPVNIVPVAGKCILVSGHDLKDLLELLQQTEGKGVNVYTHGEMLPACAYPELKKFPHLVGNYGGAWQEQAKEFDAFPGAILMTTNCIQKPRESYTARIFTTGLVQWPGVSHVPNGDFGPVIEAALAADGFAETAEPKTILTGFARNAVMSVAGPVIDAVKAGQIKHFFLIGGCDGAKPGRNYYTELAEQVPDDCVILTLACGKFRFNKLEFGDIGGIPRLLDVGQCNDAYSAVQIAVALAGAFECGVNDLPLSIVLSWYEQKAVAILLTLLNLGIKNIRIGPSLPAFVTPAVLNVLVENFNIAPVSTPQEDLAAILGN
ncbi:MAG: hydroxylamine reductase [Phycisphaerales bacterium]|nr:hydroxylamine reductase [Phycisphaerales bacterium]